MNITTKFDIGEKVTIDDCKVLVGVITAIVWRSERIINYEVSWIVGGKAESPVIEGWRLSACSVS